jgi:hypothetical protein
MRVCHALCMRPVVVSSRRHDRGDNGNITSYHGGSATGADSGLRTGRADASYQDSVDGNEGGGGSKRRRRRQSGANASEDAQSRREFESGYSEPSSSADAEEVDYFCRFCGVNVSPHDTCSLISVRFWECELIRLIGRYFSPSLSKICLNFLPYLFVFITICCPPTA